MKRYLPYADSPTIKSYTRWELFDDVLKTKGTVNIMGVVPEKILPPEGDIWFMREHIKRAESFRIDGKEVRVSSRGGLSSVHLEGSIKKNLLIIENSEEGPLSVTGRLKGKGEVLHLIEGRGPHFSYWYLEGDITIRTLVAGKDVYLRYDTRGNIEAYGVSRGGRSDVNHHFIAENTTVKNTHLLIGDKDSFLVHRPLARVYQNGSVQLETLLVKRGGVVVGVPSIEVYTAKVKEARHGVKDLILTEEQRFFLRSRGLSPEEAQHFYVDTIEKRLLGDLYERIRHIF